MSNPESRLLQQLRPIEVALGKAIEEAAGEPMCYVLIIVPNGRNGDHIVTSNISESGVIARFLSDAARIVASNWNEVTEYAEKLIKKNLN